VHTEGKGSLEKTCFKWGNIKMDLKILGVMMWTRLIWSRIDFGGALALMKLRFPEKADEFID
jgi:hypothetical protein